MVERGDVGSDIVRERMLKFLIVSQYMSSIIREVTFDYLIGEVS